MTNKDKPEDIPPFSGTTESPQTTPCRLSSEQAGQDPAPAGRGYRPEKGRPVTGRSEGSVNRRNAAHVARISRTSDRA